MFGAAAVESAAAFLFGAAAVESAAAFMFGAAAVESAAASMFGAAAVESAAAFMLRMTTPSSAPFSQGDCLSLLFFFTDARVRMKMSSNRNPGCFRLVNNSGV